MVSRHNPLGGHRLFSLEPRPVLSDFALALRALSLARELTAERGARIKRFCVP
jgi:hypothetical protein